MEQSTSNHPFCPTEKTEDVITEICRIGARKMLAAALEAEVAEYVSRFRNIVDENGHRMVTRNGRTKQRSIVTGIGETPTSFVANSNPLQAQLAVNHG